ncbi:MAG: DUF342 domain-containing protein [Chitinivibrionales bacterium]|nr:DUF342 domain-containing protein [Chitinivibrionales bacterium]
MKAVSSKKTGASSTSSRAVIQALHSLLSVELSSDGYKASVRVLQLSPQLQVLTPDIIEYLREKEVTQGVHLPAVNEIINTIKGGPQNKAILVAEGKVLQEGVDSVQEYYFRTKLMAGKMLDSKIDFRERGIINNVHEGQLIALIKLSIPGKPGIKVSGEVVNPAPLQKIKVPKAGVNVEVAQEGNSFTYKATKAGHARLLFNEIQVVSDFIISGDLDYTKGNIDFLGNVEVTGTVKSGFKVIAGGDVIIGGDVEQDAFIQAQGSITVRRSINSGVGTARVVAEGSIHAHRIINSVVSAGGDVYLKDHMAGSTVYCGGRFVTAWAKITGSSIEAIGGMILNTVGLENGNDSNTLIAGVTKKIADRIDVIEEQIERIKNEISLLSKQVTLQDTSYQSEEFEKLDISEQEKIKRIGIARSKHTKQLKDEMDELEKEHKQLLPRKRENIAATIQVKGALYPTCTIWLGRFKELKVLDDKRNACTLSIQSE